MLSILQRSRLSQAWQKLDLPALESISCEDSISGTEEEIVLRGLAAHLGGKLADAASIYASVKADQLSDQVIAKLLQIDAAYLDMKLTRSSKRKSYFHELRELARLFSLGSDALAAQIRHHALYSWFLRAFWYDQYQCLIASSLLLIYGRCIGERETETHGRQLLGHVLNVMGYPALGVPQVMRAFRDRCTLRPWLRASFFSYITYGLFMVAREEEHTALMFELGEAALNIHPDPFYRILLSVSRLRAASQIGDVVTAEAVAPFLIEISERTGSKRFLYSSKADLALCYGIRGLLAQCKILITDLNSFDSLATDPVEAGSLLRLRGWSHFFLGNYEQARIDADEALKFFGKTRSFFMAREMATILQLVSNFRLEMKTERDLPSTLQQIKRHAKILARHKKRFRQNRILLKMVIEEETALKELFPRLVEPGYSRSANVLNCLQEIPNLLQEVLQAEHDGKAWQILADTIERSFNVILQDFRREPGEAQFKVQRRFFERDVIEITIPRFISDVTEFDIVAFRCASPYQAPAALDALLALRSTLASVWRERDTQASILELARQRATSDLARQVAHDIRAPLSALNMVVSSLAGEANDGRKELIRSAATRINDIANSLIANSRTKLVMQKHVSQEPQIHHLGHLIREIVSEKLFQYQLRNQILISFDEKVLSIPAFANVYDIEFKRLLSNLIDNSVEAIDREGIVKIQLSVDEAIVKMTVADNGQGIAPELTARLFEKGATFGKSNGSGLGLYSAKKSVQNWKGSIHLESAELKGTTVVVNFPRMEAPSSRTSIPKPTSLVTI